MASTRPWSFASRDSRLKITRGEPPTPKALHSIAPNRRNRRCRAISCSSSFGRSQSLRELEGLRRRGRRRGGLRVSPRGIKADHDPPSTLLRCVVKAVADGILSLGHAQPVRHPERCRARRLDIEIVKATARSAIIRRVRRKRETVSRGLSHQCLSGYGGRAAGRREGDQKNGKDDDGLFHGINGCGRPLYVESNAVIKQGERDLIPLPDRGSMRLLKTHAQFPSRDGWNLL
jgi:hypothetical protein